MDDERMPYTVEAWETTPVQAEVMQIGSDNFREIAEWCGAESVEAVYIPDEHGQCSFRINIRDSAPISAKDDWFIVKEGAWHVGYSPEKFLEKYRKVAQ